MNAKKVNRKKPAETRATADLAAAMARKPARKEKQPLGAEYLNRLAAAFKSCHKEVVDIVARMDAAKQTEIGGYTKAVEDGIAAARVLIEDARNQLWAVENGMVSSTKEVWYKSARAKAAKRLAGE